MVANDHARCGIVTPKISTHAYKHHFIWHNLRFKGSVTVPGDTVWKQDYGFGKHISQGDCYSADIRDIRISGTFGLYTDPVLSPEHCGIYLDGISSLRNVRMDNILMSNVKYPFGIGDNVTSVFLSNADLAASWVGIKTYTTANGGEFIAQNCTFNVQRLGIELRNRSWAILDDVFSITQKTGRGLTLKT
jgi:hypothetical protein